MNSTFKASMGHTSAHTMAPAQCNLRDPSYSRLFPLDVARPLAAGLTLAVGVRAFAKAIFMVVYHSKPYIISQAEFYFIKYTKNLRQSLSPNVMGNVFLRILPGGDTRLPRDFGKATPASASKYGKDCHSPLAIMPPEARFEPQNPLSYTADIWTLAVTIWEIIGMKTIFEQ
ncbi:hypothetical protein AJ78_08160 [Emergomyces pasteurianus Ep9510]|uniref:Protein kinase domain-containing protein n=1 Tax=Emergomyces pasteurianus Ep9510 TaxID=1447872 RepID=A0A1J9P528_9EURO|nr:hypothetical protein AJ78_08160 [Emergomyces pasteurianus Ep9510]